MVLDQSNRNLDAQDTSEAGSTEGARSDQNIESDEAGQGKGDKLDEALQVWEWEGGALPSDQ